ncbi:hypothetical protein J8273_7926 [Carpediemonas membranifera]|uniref:Uncharacterized protein n=1 Tax=Carpediemonas membranifera TaxID=201153 RepID=A0A8J6ARR2_9EUKA|nr:hypothetical protein J8273_7926 [Carpediemonas membranifera]|eukprot:KAG9390575.1 hypothetical protein J8273_7926 [Carpediemonas membranifera]
MSSDEIVFTEDDSFPEFENRDICLDDLDAELAQKNKEWESDWEFDENDEFSQILRQKLQQQNLLPINQ